MRSLILGTATRFMLPLLWLFSLFLLWRGHNQPGGGFSGGLVAAASISLYALAFGVQAGRDLLRFSPRTLMGSGLLVALFSAAASLLFHRPFMTGLWGLYVPGIGELPLGTPLMFDAGVFLVVTGATLSIVFSLTEE